MDQLATIWSLVVALDKVSNAIPVSGTCMLCLLIIETNPFIFHVFLSMHFMNANRCKECELDGCLLITGFGALASWFCRRIVRFEKLEEVPH